MPARPAIVNTLLPSGHRLGRYTVIRKLSNGGFGVVYLALRDDGHHVALKEFLPSILSCRRPEHGTQVQCGSDYDTMRFQEGLKVFFREADTLAQVVSPRVIPIWDVFKANGTAYFAMPLEKGGTLQSLVRLRRNPLEEQDLRIIFTEACRGVEVLHERGLLHLDIKPSNLWIRPDRSVLVLDLGASRWNDEEMKTSQMARTPGFAAPEQHSVFRTGQPKATHMALSARTDVYGMCASLLACLMRQPPTPAPERKVGKAPMEWALLGQASPLLLDIVGRGMSMQPGLRHASITHLRQDLEKLPKLPTRLPRPLSTMAWPECVWEGPELI